MHALQTWPLRARRTEGRSMFRREALLISWLAFAWLTASVGCAVDLMQNESDVQSDPVASAAMERMLGDGEVGMLHWSLEGIDHDRSYEGVDLTDFDHHVSSRIDGIEAGPYVMTLDVISDDGVQTCRHWGRLQVTPSATDQTLFVLLCSPMPDPAAASEPVFVHCGGILMAVTAAQPDVDMMTVTVVSIPGQEDDPGIRELTRRCG
jgi:hypothetical protein